MNVKALLTGLFAIVIFIYTAYSQTHLLVYVDKDEVNVGDVIKVYGYVIKNEQKENVDVSIFLNSVFIQKVKSDNKGYYEAYVAINDPGINIIKVVVGNEFKELRIVAKQPSPEPQIVYSSEDYDVMIIVDDSKHVIWRGGKEDEFFGDNEKQYVDFSISTHELDVREYGGAKLIISIENHMNTTHLFNATTTLSNKDYYTSGILELKPGQYGEIVLFIKPLNWTNIVGKEQKVMVFMDGEKIGEETFTVSMIPRKSQIFDKVGRVEMMSLALIVLGVAALGYGLIVYRTK